MKTPDQLFPELFIEVQLSEIFPDSKTFVDMIPSSAVEEINTSYSDEKDSPSFDLLVFVTNHFHDLEKSNSGFTSDMNRVTHQHITHLWDYLKRESDTVNSGSSLLALPHPYVVPGGRFREIYYWDSYFTMLGLSVDGRIDLIQSMLDNFAFIIDTYGHIPNGNRSYYLSRSQPPFYSHMVELLAHETGIEALTKHLPTLVKEHDYWTQNTNRNISIDSNILQRYWDALDTPRQESHSEDHHLSSDDPIVNRHIRSGAESGWDFSSRWQRDPLDLSSIETTDVLPLDLNCLLYHLEITISNAYSARGNHQQSARYFAFSDRRKSAIQQVFLTEGNIYSDYLLTDKKVSDRWSLAMLYPLFVGVATQLQADATAAYIEDHFLKDGGLVTTLQHSGQQWDAPNGWPPLQWIAVSGLTQYGHSDLAVEISKRWTSLTDKVYASTGKLMEKYNVEDLTLEAGGGEYPVQDGFGWTNGVYLAMKKFLGE